MAGMAAYGRTPEQIMAEERAKAYPTAPSSSPSYDAVLKTTAGSTWQGPNAPRESYTTAPNTLGQEHDYAMQQSAADAAAKQAQTKLQAQLAAQAEQRRLDAIRGLMPGGGGAPGAPGAPAGPAYDENAARAAAFGRAKEQAGQTAQASLKALEDVMAGRGLRGSTIEGNATADVLTGGMHELNDLVRSQTISDTNRAGQVSDRNYAGDLTKRGQDMNYIQSLLGLISAGGGIY